VKKALNKIDTIKCSFAVYFAIAKISILSALSALSAVRKLLIEPISNAV